MGSNESTPVISNMHSKPNRNTVAGSYPVQEVVSHKKPVSDPIPPPRDMTYTRPESVVKRDKSFAPNINSEERLPHYSRVVDPIETINPVTGRSLYYGARPWRCDDRFQDWLQSLWGLRWQKSKKAFNTMLDCANSEFGMQPTTPYETLGRQSVMYYVDRQDHGMIRDYMFERYPFSSRDFVRVATDDGTKMQVWRHQRELELESRQNRLDDVINKHAMPQVKKKNLAGQQSLNS